MDRDKNFVKGEIFLATWGIQSGGNIGVFRCLVEFDMVNIEACQTAVAVRSDGFIFPERTMRELVDLGFVEEIVCHEVNLGQGSVGVEKPKAFPMTILSEQIGNRSPDQ